MSRRFFSGELIQKLKRPSKLFFAGGGWALESQSSKHHLTLDSYVIFRVSKAVQVFKFNKILFIAFVEVLQILKDGFDAKKFDNRQQALSIWTGKIIVVWLKI